MFTKEETNFCKGAAIILMLFHHLFNGYDEYAGYVISYSPFTPDWLTFLAVASKICVAMFVFLSGYGLAVTYRRKFTDRKPSAQQYWSFVWSRYWKLMTGYWFVFGLTLLCQPLGRTIFDAYGSSKKGILLYFIIDVLGLSDVLSTPALNPTWWYMSVAIAAILLVPLLYRAMARIGEFPVLLLLVFAVYFTETQNNSTHYLFTLALGVASYRLDLFGWFGKIGKGSRLVCAGKNIFVFLVFGVLFFSRTDYNFYGLTDGFAVLAFMLMAHTVLFRIPVVTHVMQLLGRNSANMFLVHNQLYSFYFLGFFYSFRHWALVVAALVIVSLVVSEGIELIKRKSRYYIVMEKAGEKVFAALPVSGE